MVGKTQHPLAARIKRVMQSDEDVGKISQLAPPLIGGKGLYCLASSKGMLDLLCVRGAFSWRETRPEPESKFVFAACAVDQLVEQLCKGAGAIAQERGARTVTPAFLCVLSPVKSCCATDRAKQSCGDFAGKASPDRLCLRRKAYIMGDLKLDFLKDLVTEIADLPTETSASPRKAKRQRYTVLLNLEADAARPAA